MDTQPTRQPTRNIVVIGASAGGIEALSNLVKQLPPDLPAAIFIVSHFPATSISVLPHILNRHKMLSCRHPKNGEPIQPGQVYVAPPNFHMLVRYGTIRLDQGPRENGYRPAVDSLFRSAAVAYGHRVVGVILSGMLDDGTAGLKVIKERGGLALVQDPQEALFASMPRSAITNVAVDAVLTISEIARRLTELSYAPLTNPTPVEDVQMPGEPNPEKEIVERDKAAAEQGQRLGGASPITCPDCGGVLWEVQGDGVVRFRCHVGHAYSLDSLLHEQSDLLERALWTAVRALEEKAALARRMAHRANIQGLSHAERQFAQTAQDVHEQAELVRRVISQHAKDTQAEEKAAAQKA